MTSKQNPPTSTDELENHEVRQIHIHSPKSKFTTYCSVTVSPNDETTTLSDDDLPIEILLTEGGNIDGSDDTPDPSDDQPIVIHGTDNGLMTRYTTHQHHTAVGYFLHSLELQGFAEETIFEPITEIAETDGLPLPAYNKYLSNLTPSARQLRLLDLAEARINYANDWTTEPYLETATWRDTDLSEQGIQFAERLRQQIPIDYNHCYRNAQRAAIKHADNHLVNYVEGIALPKQASQSIRHAWIEYDGSVVEITWPWHDLNGSEAVYFGVEFDATTVENTFERRNGGTQLILSDEKVDKLRDIQNK